MEEDELWDVLEEQPPPPPEPAQAAPPPRGNEETVPPPPPSDCQLCGIFLSGPPLRCGLCLKCRFKSGNPFAPAERILCYVPNAQPVNRMTLSLADVLDSTGRLPVGHRVEVRCLRVDAPEWRYELGHSWPSGISLFVGDQRVLLRKPDDEKAEASGSFDLSWWLNSEVLQVNAAITAKKTEQWALSVVMVKLMDAGMEIQEKVVQKQATVENKLRFDLERIGSWIVAHRPDRVTKKDMLRCVEAPVLKLVCCTSLSRINYAVRGLECQHLECFDLASYIHTMRSIPPKHAWCCPVCDKPVPLHQLQHDAFAQSVIDETNSDVIEVMLNVTDIGKWEISKVEEPFDDSSEDEAQEALKISFESASRQLEYVAAQPQRSAAELQQAALNLGRSIAPAPALWKPKRRKKSRSPRGLEKPVWANAPGSMAALQPKALHQDMEQLKKCLAVAKARVDAETAVAKAASIPPDMAEDASSAVAEAAAENEDDDLTFL